MKNKKDNVWNGKIFINLNMIHSIFAQGKKFALKENEQAWLMGYKNNYTLHFVRRVDGTNYTNKVRITTNPDRETIEMAIASLRESLIEDCARIGLTIQPEEINIKDDNDFYEPK